MAELVLEVDKLTKDYGGFRAVEAVTFSIKRGQVMGLLGPNGAGKSTTIQMLVGITAWTSGRVRYFGQEFETARQACLQRVNFASAYNTLQGRMSVMENMMIFAGLYGVKQRKRKIAELLSYFEIQKLAAQKYWDLSAGERTRVNLAKALLNDPELILMDEPTASLDPDIADKTLSLIEDLRRSRQLSILFTSHNMAEVARVCDEVIFLDRGHIVSQDTPSNHTKRLGGGVELVVHYRGAAEPVERLLVEAGAQFVMDKPRTAVIRTEDKLVAGLVGRLDRGGVEIKEIEVNKPTLEDVFLNIARRER